ncbi:GLPGLI family protein [Elizabethkingia meningoseptica]|uniref:GLPGLI family protein n=1 Tax=Elizabethkingia meningoseptica TaxID=238 RepID=UPI002DD63E39|nr:GLPGLI family protein [Elizabethkingia meningoseptica]MEC4711707.1 GLPGLI family protein [Elizabethkingia meningoseptica]
MKAITITLCCISALLYSQTKRYYYQLTFTDNTVKNTKRNINMVLDVNPKDVKFYEYGFIETDSLNQIPNGIKNYRGSETRQMLKRNVNSFVNTNFQQIKGNYFTFSTEDPIKWKLSDETKKTDQYKLQKATTDFGGRHWIAWFASDVMINEGPYKFRGLPGLIFEIYDDEEQFHYKLIKNKNFEKTQSTNNFVETYFGENPKEISMAVYNKLFLEYYNDPFAWARTAPEGRWVINVGGKEYKTKNDLKEATENSQRNMRESYNPIEKDKALTLK